MTMFHGLLAAASLAVATTFAASAPAAAQRMTNEGSAPLDPLMWEAQADAPRNTFFLNSENDVELIRFKRVHDIEIFAGPPDPDKIGAARRGYPIQVSWDNDVSVIAPGNCLTFDAMRVKVKPASPVPQSIDLVGTVKVLR